ncbi:START domain-containing protein [Flavobacterium cauense R2A-7]|uniref:START domain-containing protein n=1 Tax=Flavobacterium cauense R2A-7 TaxID=1341154 RepID=A0A562LZU1_9FLAO|nr:START domain-containing protein [Flavobacterium cauense]TWI13083.1 START domain-containing protein [Flavobacterium cauense R2A-7]
MKRSQILFSTLLFFLLIGGCGYSQKKPELALDKDGVKVYLTKFDTTAFKEYRAVMTVNANIDTIVKQLVDVKNLKKWNYKTRKSELLKKTSDTSWIFYMTHHLGWPIQDRDHVSKVTLTTNENERIITILPENRLLKEKPGYVRLTNFKGFWYLKKVSNTQTLVVQQIYGNPGGNIPAFMVNMVITKGPFDTFKELRKRVENLNKK